MTNKKDLQLRNKLFPYSLFLIPYSLIPLFLIPLFLIPYSFMKRVFVILCFVLSLFQGFAQKESPFGVCMHLQGGEEHVQMPTNLRLAHDAGIRFVRADFSWGTVEGPQGNWHYESLDRVVEEANKTGINMLGLLMGRPSWGRPLWEKLDAWLLYVENVVKRYKGKVRYWEVWNEPNLYPRFWDKAGDAENYALVLKATYKKIKAIDPEATVVYAGTAGIPMDYIEKSFIAGAGEGFDKMAVHPYRGFISDMKETVNFKEDIDNLRALMAKYKLEHKDIWFTEMGISSMASVATRSKEVFHELKKETGKDWRVALVCDDEFSVDPSFTAQTLRQLFPAGFKLDTTELLALRRVNANDYDAVFFPPSDNIPLHLSQVITPYLKRYMLGGGKVYYLTRNGNLYYYGDAVEKETRQALFITQMICLSLRFGIEKYFTYEMESPGENFFDREDNFGLLRRGLSPKPAYHAHVTLGRLFPEGSKIDNSIEWKQNDCCVVCWKQPNGTRVWAIWSPEGSRKVNVKIGKGLQQALHYMGGVLPNVTGSSNTLETGPGIIYLIGPETLEIN